MGDNAYCHILSGLGAGFFAVVCGSPVDVVKSRMMSESQSVEATLNPNPKAQMHSSFFAVVCGSPSTSPSRA